MNWILMLLFKKTVQDVVEAGMRALIKKVLPGFYLNHRPPKGLVRAKKEKAATTEKTEAPR